MSITFSQPLLLLLLALLPGLVWLGLRGARRTRRTWVIVGLRTASVLFLILAIAGASLVVPQDKLSVVFVVDASDSLGPEGRTSGLEWVREAYKNAGPSDRTGLILFGKDPLVEHDVDERRELGEVLSYPDATATDIPSAIRLALALFPEGTQKRIVLLSDGNNNVGDIEEAARLAAVAGAQIQTHALGETRRNDVSIEAVKAPPRVRRGESFEIEVEVSSTDPRKGTLELLGDGTVIAQRPVDIQAGSNTYIVNVGPQQKGFRRWQARVVGEGDSVHQNNAGAAFTYIESPPRVLVAEEEDGEGGNLEAALKATGLDVTRTNVSRLTRSLAGLSEYAAAALVDVPLEALPDEGRLLQTYVRDLGRGLVAVGGEQSYALGNYFNSPLEATLPVESRLKNKQKDPAVAMVMAIDKSGSMAESHTGEGGVAAGEAPKVDVAKEAALQAAQLLSPEDEFGVVAFDTAARWVIDTQPVGDAGDVGDALAGIQGGGGTNIYGGLADAVRSLKTSKASIKHVILLTDGWSETGNYDDLLAEARSAGITVSTVSAGGGSPNLLRSIAEKGNGAYYVARDNSQIPKIFVKETRLKMRNYIQEKEFTPSITAPSPVLKGLDSIPSLLGYVGTTAKPTASVALSSPEKDPVLAQWQYGLGRAVAWTSDAKSRWSANWIGTTEYARLWSQSVGWVLARPSENLQVEIAQSGGKAKVIVDALKPGGAFLNGAQGKIDVMSPSNELAEARLIQTAPGRYEATIPATEQGSYITSVSLAAAGQVSHAPTTGFAVGYSPEYRFLGTNQLTLTKMASLTGGRELSVPAHAYRHDLSAVVSTRPLWWPLTLLALLLLPLEVAVRRLKSGYLRALRTTRRTVPPAANLETAAPHPHTEPPVPEAVAPPPMEAAEPTGESEQTDATEPMETDPMDRLRLAKNRARRG